MHADLVEAEQMVEQAHVPVGGTPRADMAEDLRALAGEMLGADRGHRAGAHVGDAAGIQDRLRDAGAWVEQGQDGELGRQAALVVVHEVADDLDPGRVDRLLDRPAQHVEVPVGDAGFEMHPRLDHRLAAALARQRALDGGEDLVVGDRQRLDVETVQVSDVDGLHD